MRLISEDGTINLSFDNWDFSITSPYLNPPIFYIKASTNHREIVIGKFKDMKQAQYVLNEIQKCIQKAKRNAELKR